MKGIGHFFDKFNNSALKEIKKRTLVADSIKNETGQDIPIEKISFSNKTIIISTDQMIKSEIFLKKGKILSKIKTSMPFIEDIR